MIEYLFKTCPIKTTFSKKSPKPYEWFGAYTSLRY